MKCFVILIAIALVGSQKPKSSKSEEINIRDTIENQFIFDEYETNVNSVENSISIESFESFESISDEILSESESIEEVSTFRPFFLDKKLNHNLKKKVNLRFGNNHFFPFRTAL